MKNKVSFLLLSILASSATLFAQQSDVSVQTEAKKETKIEYGRGISYDMKESTTATAVATEEQLSHRSSINPSNLLYGLIPGLQVLQNAGYAWEDNATLLVRGMGTTNTKSPLILVDGFERSINHISSDEIESVTVLKDAASTALYGIKGANGVILVTTKRGTQSKPEINFSYQFKMGIPQRLPDFVDGYSYAQALNEGLRNDGMPQRYSAAELQAFKDQSHPDVYPNVDWLGESLRNRSYGDHITFSARGGGQYIQYYAQLNYIDDRGILKPTESNDGYSTQFKYSRLNIRTNLDIKLSETTQVKLNLFGNFNEQNRSSKTAANIFDALYQVPSGAFPVRTQNGIFGGTTQYANNPVAFISGTGYSRPQGRVMFADIDLNQRLDFITKDLSMNVKVALDNYGTYWGGETKNFAYQQAVHNWETGETSYNNLRNEGNLSYSSSVGTVSNHFNFETRLNYSHSWMNDKHKLHATLLYAMDKNKVKARNETTAFMDIVAQAHYVYNQRYLLDVALSGSASSVLNPDDRWGIFPSIGAGWVLSEEDFLKKDWLNLLKLRASYGISGRADYGANLYRGSFGGGNSYFFKAPNPASQDGMKEARLGVPGLTYEKSHKANLGIDFMGWNRLSVTADVFYDHRTDILVDATGGTSTVLGIDVPQMNSGIVDNYGVELAARWFDKIGDFSYQVGGTFSYAKNEIVEMSEQYRPYDYLKRTGRSLGQKFGYEVIGIYQSQEEIDNREVKQYLGEVRPGDLMFKDQNGDNRIDSYDQIPLGYNSSCPEIYYSFDLGAEYKGFGFYALFQGAGHYSAVLDVKSVYRPLVSNNTISTHYYNNRWTENTPNAKYPRLTSTGSTNNYNSNSLWLADASFLKLRTLEVYYQVPEKLLKNVRILSGLKVFARGHDLFSWDKINIMDPESVGANHPTMAQFSFGANLSF